MYRRPKFLTVLIRIRETMSREADYDVDLFTEMVRSGVQPQHGSARKFVASRNVRPRQDETHDNEERLTTPKRAAR